MLRANFFELIYRFDFKEGEKDSVKLTRYSFVCVYNKHSFDAKGHRRKLN